MCPILLLFFIRLFVRWMCPGSNGSTARPVPPRALPCFSGTMNWSVKLLKSSIKMLRGPRVSSVVSYRLTSASGRMNISWLNPFTCVAAQYPCSLFKMQSYTDLISSASIIYFLEEVIKFKYYQFYFIII
jgi:hypothetical protein